VPALLPRTAPRWLVDPAVDALARAGVTPNMLTLAGVLGNIMAGVLAGFGEFFFAGVTVLAFSALDFLDGALARATGRATDFGAVFDATMDRVSEAALLFGLLVYFSGRGGRTEELLIFAAVVASILVSYVRARAEAVGLRMREGVFTRLERVVLLGGGLILDSVAGVNLITPVLWILAVLAGVTVLQRLALVYRQTNRGEGAR
jgi:CDP-diacylglycerol--glycerol-3-phosphate 3-phosphatidyltransferase